MKPVWNYIISLQYDLVDDYDKIGSEEMHNFLPPFITRFRSQIFQDVVNSYETNTL